MIKPVLGTRNKGADKISIPIGIYGKETRLHITPLRRHNRRRLPVRLALPPGQAHDGYGAAVLLNDLPDKWVVLADKA